MKLHTKRLLLVPLGSQYLESTHKYSSDLENTKYMVHLPNTVVSETKEFLDRVQAEWQKATPEFYEFAILLNNSHIGAVSIYINEDNLEAELGWIISREHWGYGYAAEAAREIISFAIQELKVSRFIAHCDSENVNSYRVMQKLGMSLVNKTKGRKNKCSDEDREELLYLLEIK
ncbi:GNAT family N-acetyltransferase [Anaerocolumna sp. MB42-C2]|uniref:GNAT family N-acetyltransferase n=1 Tax=Anaerocolumna sp. MB42-C2 TaxID=3070997 RepID=UPI0027E09806|nr:GNAT family N-acetyltransferase [Anaerocolumna sp. MB42-C2]WMJ86313.1 GNAT family N-acetyltransferase [Anaerocolumna sp. MB42-C2]